jgi:hypothetical protein
MPSTIIEIGQVMAIVVWNSWKMRVVGNLKLTHFRTLNFSPNPEAAAPSSDHMYLYMCIYIGLGFGVSFFF